MEALLTHGQEVGSRNGRVKELMHVGTTLCHPNERELLNSSRRPNLAAQIAETMWVLAGRNDVEFLSHYLPRAPQFSDDGRTWRGGYGPRLRAWPVRNGSDDFLDQLAFVVDLLRDDPLTRRAVINIYDPQTDTAAGLDIPCNNWLSFSSRLGKLDLHVAVRSNDLMWGWSGINAFEWSVLQEVVAGLLGINVGSLHFSTTSLHLYDRHWRKGRSVAADADSTAKQREALDLKPSPRFGPVAGIDEFDELVRHWFTIEEGIRGGQDVSIDVDGFPEPMMQSWLRVLQWWWSGGDEAFLAPLKGTRLHRATAYSVAPPADIETPSDGPEFTELYTYDGNPVDVKLTKPSPFMQHAIRTHDSKHAAYGNSWKKRGEQLSILPNIARKVDRLGGTDTDDENAADTALDLMVYLAKYRVWLEDKSSATTLSDGTTATNKLLLLAEERCYNAWLAESFPEAEDRLKDMFEALILADEDDAKRYQVYMMLELAYWLALRRYNREAWKASNATRTWKGYGDA